MTIRRYYILPVQVLRAPLVTNRYNPTVGAERDWPHAAVAWAGKGWLAPKGSQAEDMADREQSVAFSWLFVPPAAAPLATDRVTISGQMYQVYGDPIAANTPLGLHHYEVRVMSVNG